MAQVPNLATFYLPEEALSISEDSVLVGFNFSGFCFVVMKCVPRSKFETFDALQSLVAANKQKAFKWYCAGSPMIIGVVEAGNRRRKLNQSEETVAFRRDKKVWVHLKKQGRSRFELVDVQMCGRKFTPRQHYIVYPALSPGQVISLSKLTYDDITKSSKKWDRQ